jgi:hypothetical protein
MIRFCLFNGSAHLRRRCQMSREQWWNDDHQIKTSETKSIEKTARQEHFKPRILGDKPISNLHGLRHACFLYDVSSIG